MPERDDTEQARKELEDAVVRAVNADDPLRDGSQSGKMEPSTKRPRSDSSRPGPGTEGVTSMQAQTTSSSAPYPCVECEQIGCPTEGIVFNCWTCGAFLCAGHGPRHAERVGHPYLEPIQTDLDMYRAMGERR